MPYAPHLRISALGRLGQGSGAERFSYSLNFDFNTAAAAWLGQDEEGFADMAADVAAFHGRAGSGIHSLAVLEEVKFAPIGPDGKYTGDAIIVNVADVPGAIGAGTAVFTPAPQNALAVSLTTDRRGPSGKGRFYIPMFYAQLEPSLLIPHQTAENVRASVVQLVNDLNNEDNVDLTQGKVCVSSTKGYNSDVTGVRVGRVLDTVRSRRRQISENYTSVAAVA